MPRPRKKKHIVHKYMRVKWKGGEYLIWRCMLPGCTHYLNKDMAVGQESICWRCGNIFTLGPAEMELKKPHCLECTRRRKGSDKPTAGEVLPDIASILKGLT